MIKVGCQTYTWQMAGDSYYGRLDHIIDVAGRAGYQGVESEMHFLGKLNDPTLMADHLSTCNIELASLCIVHDWRGSKETAAEREQADWVIDYLAQNFPQAILNLCPMPGTDRSDLEERQDNQLACMNFVARRAADKGLIAAYHPNSPDGSVCRFQDDYDKMLTGIDAEVLKWIPDIGHIAKGGMDPLELMKTYRSLVAHVHYKDMGDDGQWKLMGEGILDFTGITRFLMDTAYQGWIVVEDESSYAESEPDNAAHKDASYMRDLIHLAANEPISR